MMWHIRVIVHCDFSGRLCNSSHADSSSHKASSSFTILIHLWVDKSFTDTFVVLHSLVDMYKADCVTNYSFLVVVGVRVDALPY